MNHLSRKREPNPWHLVWMVPALIIFGLLGVIKLVAKAVDRFVSYLGVVLADFVLSFFP